MLRTTVGSVGIVPVVAGVSFACSFPISSTQAVTYLGNSQTESAPLSVVTLAGLSS